MKFRYPKRWSRERRKRARAVARHWHYVVLPALKRCLDRIWGDAMKPPEGFYGRGIGELLADHGPFIDDAEVLP